MPKASSHWQTNQFSKFIKTTEIASKLFPELCHNLLGSLFLLLRNPKIPPACLLGLCTDQDLLWGVYSYPGFVPRHTLMQTTHMRAHTQIHTHTPCTSPIPMETKQGGKKSKGSSATTDAALWPWCLILPRSTAPGSLLEFCRASGILLLFDEG